MIRGILKALFVGWVAKKFSQRRGNNYASTPAARPVGSVGTPDRRF